MSFETYEASHITPQYTLLEKLNAILGYIKKHRLTARFYMYEGNYEAGVTEYNKKYAIGIDEDAGDGDILVFQNRYLAVIDRLDGNNIVIQDATDIVSSVGHNYKHIVRIQVYSAGQGIGTFNITVLSSTSQEIINKDSVAFKDNASYLAQPFYTNNTDTLDLIDLNGIRCIPLIMTRGKVASSAPNAGYIHLVDMTVNPGKVMSIRYGWTSGDGSSVPNLITIKVIEDRVTEI